jgi:hypothetical protein
MKHSELKQLIKEELKTALGEMYRDHNQKRRRVTDEPFDDSEKYAMFGGGTSKELESAQAMAYKVYEIVKNNPQVKVIEKGDITNIDNVRGLTSLTLHTRSKHYEDGEYDEYRFKTLDNGNFELKAITFSGVKNYKDSPLKWERYILLQVDPKKAYNPYKYL